MKTEKTDATKRRTYRQTARAEAAAATHRRIVDVFMGFMRERWLDEITLVDVAEAAGVTVQTVIRRFSGKEGLMKAMAEVMTLMVAGRREAPPGDLQRMLEALVRDYEADGDMMIRCLAQEGRSPVLKILLNTGRAEHRQWVEDNFKPWLVNLAPERYERCVLKLIVITDVYTWKLLRRDQGRTPENVVEIMAEFVIQLFAESAPALSATPKGEPFNEHSHSCP